MKLIGIPIFGLMLTKIIFKLFKTSDKGKKLTLILLSVLVLHFDPIFSI